MLIDFFVFLIHSTLLGFFENEEYEFLRVWSQIDLVSNTNVGWIFSLSLENHLNFKIVW